MFKILFGAALGAVGYWGWQSFGRDMLGMGSSADDSNMGGSTPYTAASNSASSFGPPPSPPASSEPGPQHPSYIGTPGVESALGRDRTKDGDLPGDMARP